MAECLKVPKENVPAPNAEANAFVPASTWNPVPPNAMTSFTDPRLLRSVASPPVTTFCSLNDSATVTWTWPIDPIRPVPVNFSNEPCFESLPRTVPFNEKGR